IIVDGDQVLIAGQSKSGKSWMALQLALAAASGGEFLRWRASRPMKTLYINLEVGHSMWARRVVMQGEQFASSNPESFRGTFFTHTKTRTLDVLDPGHFKAWQQKIKTAGYEFVVIDVLSRCHSV